MKKVLFFIALSLLFFQGSAVADDAGLVTTEVDDSYFASDEIMAQGSGTCILSGTQTFSGGCDIQFLKQNEGKVFDVTLDDGKGNFVVKQVVNGTSGQYVTNIEGTDVATTMEEVSLGQSVITMGDLKLQVTLLQLVTRKQS
jgi:hypothetical protein